MRRFLAVLLFLIMSLAGMAMSAPIIVIPGEGSGHTYLLTDRGEVEASSKFAIGAIDVFMSHPVPAGWLECDGSTIQATDYPELVRHLAGASAVSATLPDYRGEFLRGLDGGRGVDPGRALNNVQPGQMLAHTHTGTATPAGAHTHTGDVSLAGEHTHIIPRVTPPNYSGTYLGSGGGYAQKRTSAYTLGAGSHVHAGDLALSGTHTHAGTLGDSGGVEFRPRNIAVIYAIRAK